MNSSHSGVHCAYCRAGISGARVICLDCHALRDTLDLCEKADCLAAVIGPDRRVDLPTPHLPSHRLLKVRKVIHRHREFGGTYRAAHDALLRAEEALSDASAAEGEQGLNESVEGTHYPETRAERIVGRELSCIGCRARVSSPCWYCIECEGTSPSYPIPSTSELIVHPILQTRRCIPVYSLRGEPHPCQGQAQADARSGALPASTRGAAGGNQPFRVARG